MATKIELFLELAQPNEEGISRWVSVDEFQWKYVGLVFWNGRDWARDDGKLWQKYIIEVDKTITSWNRVDRIRLAWLNLESIGDNSIRADIKRAIKQQRCVVLGTAWKQHKQIETDHKNGFKNDPRVMNIQTQRLDDFQPLSKAANDAKRQFCKECKRTGKRYDAKLLWYPVSFMHWDENHDLSPNGCVGCFWYDPIEFRKHLKFTWN